MERGTWVARPGHDELSRPLKASLDDEGIGLNAEDSVIDHR